MHCGSQTGEAKVPWSSLGLLGRPEPEPPWAGLSVPQTGRPGGPRGGRLHPQMSRAFRCQPADTHMDRQSTFSDDVGGPSPVLWRPSEHKLRFPRGEILPQFVAPAPACIPSLPFRLQTCWLPQSWEPTPYKQPLK